MRYIKLRDLEVSRIGPGAIGMSHGYTDSGTDEAESVRTLDRLTSLPATAGATHTEAGRLMLEL
jgi:hypothetical protein